MFLKPEFPVLACHSEIKIVGKIDQCPNRTKNGNRFKITWVAFPFDMNSMNVWLENTPKNRGILKGLIVDYEIDHPAVPVTATTPNQRNNHSTQQPGTRRNNVQVTPARAAQRAVIMTAPDESDMSTLTFSVAPATNPENTGVRTTRRSEVFVESDTDEDDDEYVDESAWVPREDNDDVGDDEEEDDEQEEQEETSDRTPGSVADCVRNLDWKFSEVAPEDVRASSYRQYEGPSGVRRNIAEAFSDPSSCLALCGGLSNRYIGRLAANSNAYYHSFIKPTVANDGKWHHLKWKDITRKEMSTFLGIILKISLRVVDGGGYPAYFATEDKTIHTGLGPGSKSKLIKNSAGFASKYMALRRFKQIRGAFHPENKAASFGGDKCYQLRHALKVLNAASMATFIPSAELAFDEGGIGYRSRLCPVRQYNSSKPDPYRVDFFILADSNIYAIHHCDVYQGKNKENVEIDPRAVELPTTQKAVLNAVYKRKLDNEYAPSDGHRHISMDNRYVCPEVCLILRDRCGIYSTGTARKNRKGWDKQLLNMEKRGNKWESKICVDRTHQMVALQWRDSKVVSVCSSVMDTTMAMTLRRVGGTRPLVEVPTVLKKYQTYMGGVDRGDQIRMHLGGFAKKSHFKKWYKRSLFAIQDMMLLNALIAWNESAKIETLQRRKFERHEFFEWVADDLLNGTMGGTEELLLEEDTMEEDVDVDGNSGNVGCETIIEKGRNAKCVVCRLESNYSRDYSGLRCNTISCLTCEASVHNDMLAEPKKIHSYFPGMTCHQILKSKLGKEIWIASGKRHTVRKSHPIVKSLKRRLSGEDDATIGNSHTL